jgi:cobalt-zinc-cadmium resistance protein CzcA
LLAAIGLLAAGLWSASRLPIDAVPDITNIQVQINTEVKGLAPEEIEKLVTYPLEMEMFGVPGMIELRSLSKFGLSQITLVFEEGTDIYRARQLVSERLQNAVDDLPSNVSPKLAPITTGLGEIYYYVVDYQPGYDGPDKARNRAEQLMELKLVHDFVVKPQLRSVPGIAEVNASGGYEKQIVILPKPESSSPAESRSRNWRHHRRERRERGWQRHPARWRADLHPCQRPREDGRRNRQSASEITRRRGTVARERSSRGGNRQNIRTGSATYNGQETVLGAALMLSGETVASSPSCRRKDG